MRTAMLVWAAWLGAAAVGAEEACGGLFNSSARGVIHTPNFPRPFPVPIRCRWIILTNSPSPSIVVYLTQVYVTSGLSVTEYSYYESESYNYGRKVVHRVTDQNVTETKWLWSGYPALIIDFQLDALEGHHLRVLDTLLDVYGFNITFEVGAPVHAHTCNALECSFNGDCVAAADFS
ncbi:uncharacterized protein LOC124556264 [Schistocerca americana]|uniref:uncharacterized protein LOC124556264 n=1 Tax=Schistocerca americana TaxID=7009 RepID=UPI001F4F1F29|nr:uncharacterized protein LOC124556264 [Schistocerca americana]XP_049954772.1 uncharacterized protein LOC126470802 [Schistocerca serialis cubense]